MSKNDLLSIKKKEVLILVSRPINFLFAFEVYKRLEGENFTILIYPNSDQQDKNACIFLMDEFREYFKNTRFIFFKTILKNDFLNLHYFNLWVFFKSINTKFDVLSTSGGVKGRIVYKHTKPESLILTDEGTSSIQKFPVILETNQHFPTVKKKFYKKLYKTLGVFELKNSKKFKILTVFDKVANLDERIEFIHLDNWKSLLKDRNFELNKDEIIILGSVPESIKMNYSTYKKKIDRIYGENPNNRILIKPHKNFQDNLGYNELKTDFPIEYFFIKRNSIPQVLYSFGSTSNILLKNLFPDIIIRDLL